MKISSEYFSSTAAFTPVQAQAIPIPTRDTAARALRAHWPEYLIEAAALGAFMVSACVFSVLLDHPASAVHQAIPNAVLRRVLAGIAMGVTAVGIICSPWGQRSGAHMNPAFTLAFLTLGKVKPWDALFYAVSQFAGGVAGVVLSGLLIGPAIADTSVNYVVTHPGPGGPWAAFWAEFAISFVLLTVVLNVANRPRTARFTPYLAGVLIAIYISIEAPVSGMSMNPARTLGSALPAGDFAAIWIYFTAPPIAMLLAGQLYRRCRGAHRVFCAKWHHHNHQRCIFRCNYGALHNGQ